MFKSTYMYFIDFKYKAIVAKVEMEVKNNFLEEDISRLFTL